MQADFLLLYLLLLNLCALNWACSKLQHLASILREISAAATPQGKCLKTLNSEFWNRHIESRMREKVQHPVDFGPVTSWPRGVCLKTFQPNLASSSNTLNTTMHLRDISIPNGHIFVPSGSILNPKVKKSIWPESLEGHGFKSHGLFISSYLLPKLI